MKFISVSDNISESNKEYIYNEYPHVRDVVFFMGAGASHADGAPLQSEIIPLIYSLEDKIMKNSNAYKEVLDFINRFFSVESKERYPTLEQIYAYIEYHLNNNENINYIYNIEKLKKIKTSLNYIIHYIIDIKCKERVKGVYSNFWDKISSLNKNISVITLNYDTLLEEGFDKIYLKDALIDYVIDFINYDTQINIGDNWWINPCKPIYSPYKGEKSSSVPIKIIKPHGSLNWKYCNCCNRVFITHWNNKVDLNNLTFDKKNANDINYRCPYDKSLYTQLLIPPTHYKKISNRIFARLFSECLREIRIAKKICFIGYSFPEFDIHIKAIFDKIDLTSKEVYCINASIKPDIVFNYKLVNDKTIFIEEEFENFIKSNLFYDLLKK